MDELAERLHGLRERVVPAWDPSRKARAYHELQRVRRARALRMRGAVAGAGVVAAVLCVTFIVDRATESRHEATRATAPSYDLRPSRRIALSEGSAIELRSLEAQLVVESDEPQRIAVRLNAGAAHFDVVPNMAQRQFSVFAGSIEIVVVGTAFDVARSSERVRVAVTHGKVRVQSPGGATFIAGGESREFDDEVSAPLPAADDSPAKPHAAAQRRRREPAAPRTRAESASNEVDALMNAADVARQSGHLESAALYLRKVVSGHRESPATPLAAFTLGRLLLERLGRPGEAATAFAAARELAPAGSLASDALAREVEAWSKAGRADVAAERARVFLQAYPDSRRARVMELYVAPQP